MKSEKMTKLSVLGFGTRRILAFKLLALPLAIAILSASCSSTKETEKNKSVSLKIEIDYGGIPGAVQKDLVWTHGNPTALEAVQAVAKVNTRPIGKYIFVSSIDGIETRRREKAWYYTVNGKSPGKLAVWNELKDGDTVRWIYKKDVCSPKIDGSKAEVAK